MPTYSFLIEIKSIGKGYVEADSIEEARQKIEDGDYDDIYDEVGEEFGEIIDIEEDED